MGHDILIRPTHAGDRPAVDALLEQSYPVLLRRDYTPTVLAACLPHITRARPELMACGTYYMAHDASGAALAAGGWTHNGPQGGIGPRDVGHIRHVVTHPAALRRGFARALIERSFAAARNSGVRWMMCQSTLTAEGFYASLGFTRRGEIDVRLDAGLRFPAVEMIRAI